MDHSLRLAARPRPARSSAAAAAPGLLRRIAATLATWQARHRQRRELRELDDRLLRDIGISRAAAEAEARKPFWRR